ncbi:hypothetical protein Tco_0961785 [Tanacetum coccineum]
MLTQQDIYVAGCENRPPLLNIDNYVPWFSRLLRYAKSKPNGKLLMNSIKNDDELTNQEAKQMEADDQAIQTILMSLPEDIYAAIDSCESIESYYHRFSKLMNDFFREKHFLEKIASNLKFLNNFQLEWNRSVTIVHQTKDLYQVDYTQLYDFLKFNQAKVNEIRAERLAKAHDPLTLMGHSQTPHNYPVFHHDHPSHITYMQHPPPNNNYKPQPSFNQNYIQQPMPNPKDILDPTTVINISLVLIAKAFKLNYSTPTNNNQRISSNPRNSQIAQSGNQNGYNAIQNVGNQNGNGNVVATRAKGNVNGNNGDIDEIEDVNVNYVLMANLRVEQSRGTVDLNLATADEIRTHFESLYNNLTTEVERVNMANHKMRETNADLTTELTRYKTKPDLFYHTEQKMALGYPNPHYLKQVQQKQQSLYNGRVLLEKHDPPVVYDSNGSSSTGVDNTSKTRRP